MRAFGVGMGCLFDDYFSPLPNIFVIWYSNQPVHQIKCSTRNGTSASVKQKLVYVGSEDGKILAIRQIFQQVQRMEAACIHVWVAASTRLAAHSYFSPHVHVQGIKPPVLIFVQSIERAKDLFHELS